MVSLCLALAGCGVRLKSQTPGSFTYTHDDLAAVEAPLYPESTPGQLGTLLQSPAHRFLLEVQPYGGASNVRPVAVVDGVEYPLARHGATGGLYVYEAQPPCPRNYYDYHFQVRYRAGWLGNRTTTLGSAATPFRVAIDGAPALVWFVAGMEPKRANGSMKVVNGVNGNETVVRVQNLSDTPIRVATIGWVIGEPDAPKFELLNRPVFPHVLTCGQSIDFTVKWNPVGSDLDDMARFGIRSQHQTTSGTWDNDTTIFITARGVIGP
jgi:hypothetical protein